jgi:hypothetical protein
VRLTHLSYGGALEMACTYDIHPRGARLLTTRELKVGDLIAVERGRSKAICRVAWTADPKSTLRGQVTVEYVEGRIPWEEELRQMEERYLPLLLPGTKPAVAQPTRRGEQNRRLLPRFQVEGAAELAQLNEGIPFEGKLEDISQRGCLISVGSRLVAGTGLRVVLNTHDVTVALKGDVKYAAQKGKLGVEFREIRQGDRPLFDYVLSQVGQRVVEDFADLEVVTEAGTAAAK